MKKRLINNSLNNKLKKIKFILLDIDGVVVPRGTKIEQKGENLKINIKKIPESQIEKIKTLSKKGYVFGINSGRGLYMLQNMFSKILPYLIITYENGSATWYKGKIYQHSNSFDKLYKVRQELEKVKHPNIKGFEPKEFIITVHCKKRVKEIEKIVSKYKELYSIWNDEAYDIGVKGLQTKARGLKEVMKTFKIKKQQILFVGDNYNDRGLGGMAGVIVSADKTRLKGDIYVSMHEKKLPAEQVMDIFLNKLK